jgi:hypothetical protein
MVRLVSLLSLLLLRELRSPYPVCLLHAFFHVGAGQMSEEKTGAGSGGEQQGIPCVVFVPCTYCACACYLCLSVPVPVSACACVCDCACVRRFLPFFLVMLSMFEFFKRYKEFFLDASEEDMTAAWQEERQRQERERERQLELEKLRLLQKGDDSKGVCPCPLPLPLPCGVPTWGVVSCYEECSLVLFDGF